MNGKNASLNRINKAGHFVAFKLRAPLSDAATTKFINWNEVKFPAGETDYIS
jgi:hypothetical protein